MRISDWSSECALPICQVSGAPNGGRGFFADLGGNELPNSPRLTFNLGAQYTAFIDGGDWELTFRGDYYRQSKSFARVYNTEYDRLKAWDNLNLRPEEHTSELQSLMRISYAVFALKKKTQVNTPQQDSNKNK